MISSFLAHPKNRAQAATSSPEKDVPSRHDVVERRETCVELHVLESPGNALSRDFEGERWVISSPMKRICPASGL